MSTHIKINDRKIYDKEKLDQQIFDQITLPRKHCNVDTVQHLCHVNDSSAQLDTL